MSFDVCGGIALVGTGNVASHLAHALAPQIKWVFSRSFDHARGLADDIGAEPYSDFGMLARISPGVVLVSIADRAIADVVAAIGNLDCEPLVLHTSGTMPKEVLEPLSPRIGILYPLQTFSKGVDVDMSRVPFFNEAAREDDLALIDAIAASISTSVHHADATHRQVLHVAGVFTSNFTNVLLECVDSILGEAGYSLDVVRPLLEATVNKAYEVGPHAAQTGPARRGDSAVIEKHVAWLPDRYKDVYRVLSDMIIKNHNL